MLGRYETLVLWNLCTVATIDLLIYKTAVSNLFLAILGKEFPKDCSLHQKTSEYSGIPAKSYTLGAVMGLLYASWAISSLSRRAFFNFWWIPGTAGIVRTDQTQPAAFPVTQQSCFKMTPPCSKGFPRVLVKAKTWECWVWEGLCEGWAGAGSVHSHCHCAHPSLGGCTCSCCNLISISTSLWVRNHNTMTAS